MEKSQDILANSVVLFTTIKATIELRDSANKLIDTSTALYDCGGWQTIGNT